MDTCPYHTKHDQLLQSHDKDIDALSAKFDVARERSSQSHADIYTEIKTVDRSKVSTNLFYLFISVYSALYLLGIVFVYKGMHQNSLTFLTGISEVKTMQVELKGLTDEITEIRQDLKIMGRRP